MTSSRENPPAPSATFLAVRARPKSHAIASRSLNQTYFKQHRLLPPTTERLFGYFDKDHEQLEFSGDTKAVNLSKTDSGEAWSPHPSPISQVNNLHFFHKCRIDNQPKLI